MSSSVDAILSQVKSLPPDEQIEVAEAIDRLTWAQRWRRICQRIENRGVAASSITDDEIDRRVRQVRQETPLSERSSIPPS